MAPCLRELEIKATPAKIWQSCFAPMKWETWDPDAEGVEDVSGPLANGTTFTFVMKDENFKRVPIVLSNVEENKSLRFSGVMWGGVIKYDGDVTISAKDETTSIIEYSFDLHGLLGSIVGCINPKPIEEGVVKGLENMKALSE